MDKLAAHNDLKVKRRNFLRFTALALLVPGLCVGRSTRGWASAQGEAGPFLLSVTTQAIEQLTDASVDVEERKDRFRTLFRESFDIPRIGRFVLGRYWRGTSEEVRQQFLSTFEDVMVERFAPQFADYGDTRFQLGVVRQVKDKNQYVVSSTITPPGSETVQVDWRLRRGDGKFKILDVVGQGVSMVLTLRSEYSSVLKNSGGKVENLIDRLRTRIDSQAGIAAKSAAN